MDAIRNGLNGKMCPNCYGTIFPGEFHSCPAQSINEVAKERDSLRKQLDETNNQLGNAIRNTTHWKNEVSVEVKVKVNLEKQLEVAMKAMKSIPHNINHTKHGACHGCEMDEALAEIEKIGGEK
jgi:hypothetical protein